MGKNHRDKTIGWAVVIVHLLGNESVELTIDEIENKHRLHPFFGKTFFYEKLRLFRSNIRPGINHPYTIEAGNGTTVSLAEGRKYVVLANFYCNPPQIYGGETLEVFDAVRNQLSEGIKPRYRVTFMEGERNRGVTGTLDHILKQMKDYLGKDPKDFLKSSQACWYQEIGGTFESSPRLKGFEVGILLK